MQPCERCKRNSMSGLCQQCQSDEARALLDWINRRTNITIYNGPDGVADVQVNGVTVSVDEGCAEEALKIHMRASET